MRCRFYRLPVALFSVAHFSVARISVALSSVAHFTIYSIIHPLRYQIVHDDTLCHVCTDVPTVTMVTHDLVPDTHVDHVCVLEVKAVDINTATRAALTHVLIVSSATAVLDTQVVDFTILERDIVCSIVNCKFYSFIIYGCRTIKNFNRDKSHD